VRRTYTLGRLAAATGANLRRLRLVWGRLWAAAAAHLVAAACHGDAAVACLAVAHLRGLAGRLLSQAELPAFMHQARAPSPASNDALDEARQGLHRPRRQARKHCARQGQDACLARRVMSAEQGALGHSWAPRFSRRPYTKPEITQATEPRARRRRSRCARSARCCAPRAARRRARPQSPPWRRP